MNAPRIAVIGGTGFYSFLDDPQEHVVETPYGSPSAPITLGTVSGREVAFVPRHGQGHAFPPHRINYRANLWALRSLGVRQVFAPCAVGGLQEHTPPGALVVPDQLVDRTSGRVQTFVESGAVHVPFADPYCPRLRSALIASTEGVVDGGTLVVIEGPRFSTRAESRWFADQGWDLVNMTAHPEAVLARELGLCYASLALVTDTDAGVEEGEAVDQAQVFALFAENLVRLRGVLASAVGLTPDPDGCTCASWTEGIEDRSALP